MVEVLKSSMRGVLALGLAGLVSVAVAAPIIFQGLDVGASSLAAAPTAKAASDAFDAATGPLTIIDFDSNTTDATLSPASASFPEACEFAQCSGNTTAGNGFYGALHTTTVTVASRSIPSEPRVGRAATGKSPTPTTTRQ